MREGPLFGCTLESPGSLRNTIPRSHLSHPSQNLGDKGSSENHQLGPLLLKAWSLDVSCGIDRKCVGNIDPGPCQTASPESASYQDPDGLGAHQSCRGVGLVMSTFPCSWTPYTYKVRRGSWGQGPTRWYQEPGAPPGATWRGINCLFEQL